MAKIKVTKLSTNKFAGIKKILPIASKTSGVSQSQAFKNRNKLLEKLYGSKYLQNINRIVAEDTLKSSSIKQGSSEVTSAGKSLGSTGQFGISGRDNVIGGIRKSYSSSKGRKYVATPESEKVAESLKTSLSSIDKGVPVSSGFNKLSLAAKSQGKDRFGISGRDNVIGGIRRSYSSSKGRKYVATPESKDVAESIKTSLRSIDRTLPVYSGLVKIASAGRSIDRANNKQYFRMFGKTDGKRDVRPNLITGVGESYRRNKNRKFVSTTESREVADALKKTSKIYAIGKGIGMIYDAANSSGTSKDKIKMDKKGILETIRKSYERSRKQDLSPKTAEQKAVAKALGISVDNLKTAVSDPEVQAQSTVLVASALTPAVISRTPNLYRAATLRATGKYIPAEEIFSKQALQSELKKGPLGLTKKKGAGLTTGYNPKRTIKAFKETKGKLPYRPRNYVGVTATDFPGTIKKSELVTEKVKQFLSKKGLPEDPGIYITPYGKGQTLFLRIGSKGSGYSYSFLPKVTFSKPSAYVVGFKRIGKYPRQIIKGKGFNITKLYQEKFGKGKSKALITKRMTLGGTSEPEAVIPLGDRLYPIKTRKSLYTVINKEVVPVYRTELKETLKNKLLYRARANRIKVNSKNTTKQIIDKLKKKGKYNSKLIDKIKRETTDLYSMSTSSGKKVLIPLPYYKYPSSKSSYSSSSYKVSSSSGKSSTSSSSSSTSSSKSSSTSRSSGRSGGSSGGSSGGGSSGGSSGGGSSGRSSGSSRSEKYKYEEYGVSRYSNRPRPNRPRKIQLIPYNKYKIKKKGLSEPVERAFKTFVKSGNRFVEINKDKKLNYFAALNSAIKKVDDIKSKSFFLKPTNMKADKVSRSPLNLIKKFNRRKNNVFIEKSKYVKDRPLEKMRSGRK